MEEVANLRQNWGVTVRTRIRRRVEVTATSATSKRCSFARRSGSPQHPAQEKTSRGVDSWQLPQDVTSGGHCDDTQTIPAQLCYSNCHISKSRPSLLIRSRLSSPCSASLDRMRAMSSRRCRSPLVVFMMTVLICLLHVTAAKKAGETKTPLVRADVTTQRTFRGRGTLTKQQPKAGVLTIRSGAVHGVIAESRPLDFQTLKVVTQWDDYTTEVLLVSGRDYVYMINASQTSTNEEMTFIERLKWTAEPSLQDQCLAMGKQPYECNNFIRVVELLDDGRLYVCGTNAYKPLCRHYERSQFALPASDANTQYSTEKGCHSSCECPFDPTTSSAHLYTNTSNGFQLFTGVVGDYLGNKPLLMRNNNYVSSVNTWLSDPSFIKLIEYGEKVYLFFRETADQLETGSGMLTYSRVAQVCKDDLGGASAVLSSRWTTFLKARLECSIPSSPGTYSEGLTFNNLTSVSDVTTVMVNGQAVDVVFATFTTPWSWHAVSMSAVCMFPIRESIERLFNEGSFQAELLSSKIDLEQPHSAIPHQRAVPVPENQVPSPRPGSCRKDPLPDNVLNFAKNHQLMYTPVKPMFNQPIFLSESEVKVTQIVLDNKAGDEDNLVLYLGTESGTILRIRPRLHAAQGPKTVLLQELQIADKGGCRSGELKCGVLALHVARPSSTSPPSTKSSLFVAFTDRMAQVEAAKCDLYSNENCCNADPECGWHVENEKCVGRTRKNSNTLPPIRPIDEVPTDCEIPPPAATTTSNKAGQKFATKLSSTELAKTGLQYATDDTSNGLATADSEMLIFIIIAVLMLLVGIALGSVFMHCLQSRRGTHRVAEKGKNRSDSESNEMVLLTSHLMPPPVDSQMDYMVIGRSGSGRSSPAERPSSLAHQSFEITVQPYDPPTPSSLDEKAFLTTEDEQRVPFCEINEKRQQEKASLFPGEMPETSDVLESGTTRDDLTAKEEKVTPPLPPKQRSIKESSFLPAPPLMPDPHEDNSSVITSSPNNNNNNNSIPQPISAPSPNVIEPSLSSTDRSIPDDSQVQAAQEVITPLLHQSRKSPRSPPSVKPPIALRKHQTFSGPHGQKLKPPVPPKSRAAVVRSASLRTNPATVSSSMHETDLGDDVSRTLPKMPSTRVRTPSYRHNSNAARASPRAPIPVSTPTVPSL